MPVWVCVTERWARVTVEGMYVAGVGLRTPGHRWISAWAPGKEKLHIEATTVFKVGGDGKSRDLMPGQQRATESGKEEHSICFCANAVAFQAY